MKSKPKQQLEKRCVELHTTEFPDAVIRTAISQICKSVGFMASQLSTLEILADVATKFLELIGKTTVSFTNASNRTQSNIFDIINALNDINLVIGFQGASSLHKKETSLLTSSTLSDLICFFKYSPEIPFALPLPCVDSNDSSQLPEDRFGSSCASTSEPNSCQGLHIPRWLPPIPDESTYIDAHGTLSNKRKHSDELWESIVLSKSNELNLRAIREKVLYGEKRKVKGKIKFKIHVATSGGNSIGIALRSGVSRGEKKVYGFMNSYDDCIDEEKETNGCKIKTD